MDASFFSKPLSQLECRDNKKSCHLLEKKGTHPMRMHDNNTTCNRSNQNAGFLDTTNTTCNRNKNHVLLKCGTMLKSIPCLYSSPPLLEMMCSRHRVMVCLNCQRSRQRQRPIKMACRIVFMRSYNSETETDANFTGFCTRFISICLGVGQCE